jgi:muramoyltetrapeptide carboxypeptidase
MEPWSARGGEEAFIVPRPLAPGARIAVVAPSSPFDRTLLLRGVAWLGERYRVEFDWRCCEREGFLAGSDQRRLEELDRDDIAAIVAARGGYGLTRFVHRVNFAALRRSPKWLVGFSDVTALHLEALAQRVASVHAENAAGLGRGDTRARREWVSALEDPRAVRTFGGLKCVRSGTARGVLAGGNLTLLFTQAAAGRLRLPDGAVLVIEDVTEAAYRVDRMLTALLVGGAFDRVSAVVTGDFTDCPPSRGVSVEQVLAERLAELRVPVLTGLPFGHGERNVPLVFGLPAAVDGAAGTLTLG